MTATWLVKSEPDKYAWDDLVRDRRTVWDGVRNHAAAINLRAMTVGDLVFFYHSNVGKAIVGIAEVVREHFIDPKDATGRFPAVEMALVAPLARPVTLAEIKAEALLTGIELVRQSRLSVVPIRAAEWTTIIAMSKA